MSDIGMPKFIESGNLMKHKRRGSRSVMKFREDAIRPTDISPEEWEQNWHDAFVNEKMRADIESRRGNEVPGKTRVETKKDGKTIVKYVSNPTTGQWCANNDI